MAADRRRRILKFFGPRGDLLAAEAPGIVVYDGLGHVRLTLEVEDFVDIAPVGDELWVVAPQKLIRISARDGKTIATEPLEYLDPNGRFIQSSTAPHLPVWHAGQPVIVRVDPVRTEVPGPGGEVIMPIADGRWLLWEGGQLHLWRTIGEAWRRPVGEPGVGPIDAQIILDGRLFVLAQQRPVRNADEGAELRLTVVGVADGALNTQLRVPNVTQLAIVPRRGLAITRSGDRLNVIDLRFGRWIRELVLPAGTTEFAVDDGLQRIALAHANGLELVRPDALAPQAARDPDEVEAEARAAATGAPAPIALAISPDGHDAIEVISEPPPSVAEPAPVEIDEPLPEAPLVRLDPISVSPTATPAEISDAVDLDLRLVAARVGFAIAEGWDTGRIIKLDPLKPPFSDEVAGLLAISSGRTPGELAAAQERLHKAEAKVLAGERRRAGQLTPLEVLTRDFHLSPLAVSILVTIAAPRLRGQLARLYGILANDPGRALVDEYLLGQIHGMRQSPDIARELDGDRPLRRFGLVHVGLGDRPFAALSVDSLVVRYIANQSADGEPDQFLQVRRVDRDLDELQMPRGLIAKALRFLASGRDNEPVRIVVRGRTGSGRHTFLTSLAARAGRSLGVIDLGTVPREGGRIAGILEDVLRRAMLRGLLPCVDGLELATAVENPDTKIQLQQVLRAHPGPIALRMPSEAVVPLDPGYLQIDIPARDERLRTVSWNIALERHGIDLSDGSELAARYRVGPGIIERVCSEVARRPDRPADPAAWMRELDDTVRQHLENRLGTTANRVTRLASWADIVLPEDIIDSLLELTSRVRHRKKVYEQWGFDRSITTARGITALFQGSPGTGKTMVAGVIARDLGLEVYRVDVSRITSKWIGETEKNLGSLFDAAEDGQVMLLFDEADSLFAKRTEVKSSVDRYANMEVNYLLQRLDTFEGIAILTTNFGNAIDPAFKRRLTYRVTFPFPDEEMREQLWRTLIPPQLPTQGILDFAKLSQKFRLSGGYIRNATLRAAFLAAEEGGPLTHEHLERAIRMEFREIGKLAESGTLE